MERPKWPIGCSLKEADDCWSPGCCPSCGSSRKHRFLFWTWGPCSHPLCEKSEGLPMTPDGRTKLPPVREAGGVTVLNPKGITRIPLDDRMKVFHKKKVAPLSGRH